MRKLAWALLLIYCFAIPWEYSLDWGPPLGNVARLAGLLTLLVAIPVWFGEGRMRRPGAVVWLSLLFFLWICCTCLWSVDPDTTSMHLRAWVQEMLPLWLIWELAESPEDLRDLLRATVAGSWVLALLTLANLATIDAVASEQIRFAAAGQDPNDVARFLDLGFPLAVLLAASERRWAARLLAWSYLPLGLVGVLLTASRGGFLTALVALAGSMVILLRRRPWAAAAGAMALPVFVGLLWRIAPRATFERLATIPEQLRGGDLNVRLNIWQVGWQAYKNAPFFGHGMGAFTAAAHLLPTDTAHNTLLSLAVGGGMVAVLVASVIVVVASAAVLHTRGTLRWTLGVGLLVWLLTSLVATVEENRSSWLLLGLIALAGRLAAEQPRALAACFESLRPESSEALKRQAA